MKSIALIIPLITSAMPIASASEYFDRQVLRIDLAELPSLKICIYKNELFSEGAEIKMESQKYYRCERYQPGKTTDKKDVQLRWVAISPSN